MACVRKPWEKKLRARVPPPSKTPKNSTRSWRLCVRVFLLASASVEQFAGGGSRKTFTRQGRLNRDSAKRGSLSVTDPGNVCAWKAIVFRWNTVAWSGAWRPRVGSKRYPVLLGFVFRLLVASSPLLCESNRAGDLAFVLPKLVSHQSHLFE